MGVIRVSKDHSKTNYWKTIHFEKKKFWKIFLSFGDKSRPVLSRPGTGRDGGMGIRFSSPGDGTGLPSWSRLPPLPVPTGRRLGSLILERDLTFGLFGPSTQFLIYIKLIC